MLAFGPIAAGAIADDQIAAHTLTADNGSFYPNGPRRCTYGAR